MCQATLQAVGRVTLLLVKQSCVRGKGTQNQCDIRGSGLLGSLSCGPELEALRGREWGKKGKRKEPSAGRSRREHTRLGNKQISAWERTADGDNSVPCYVEKTTQPP